MNGSRGYSQEALRRLETGTYRGRKQQYRTSEDQVKAIPKKVPALEGMTRSPSFDRPMEREVDTTSARRKYEQRIGHNATDYRNLRNKGYESSYNAVDFSPLKGKNDPILDAALANRNDRRSSIEKRGNVVAGSPAEKFYNWLDSLTKPAQKDLIEERQFYIDKYGASKDDVLNAYEQYLAAQERAKREAHPILSGLADLKSSPSRSMANAAAELSHMAFPESDLDKLLNSDEALKKVKEVQKKRDYVQNSNKLSDTQKNISRVVSSGSDFIADTAVSSLLGGTHAIADTASRTGAIYEAAPWIRSALEGVLGYGRTAGETRHDLERQGVDTEKARQYANAAGMVVGASNAAAGKAAQMIDGANWLTNALTEGGLRGGVSMTSQAALELANKMIFDNQATFNTDVQKYKNQGLSEGQATARAALNVATRVLGAGAAGFIGGFGTSALTKGIGKLSQAANDVDDGLNTVWQSRIGQNDVPMLTGTVDNTQAISGTTYNQVPALVDNIYPIQMPGSNGVINLPGDTAPIMLPDLSAQSAPATNSVNRAVAESVGAPRNPRLVRPLEGDALKQAKADKATLNSRIQAKNNTIKLQEEIARTGRNKAIREAETQKLNVLKSELAELKKEKTAIDRQIKGQPTPIMELLTPEEVKRVNDFKTEVRKVGNMWAGESGKEQAKRVNAALDKYIESGSQEDLREYAMELMQLQNSATESYTSQAGNVSRYSDYNEENDLFYGGTSGLDSIFAKSKELNGIGRNPEVATTSAPTSNMDVPHQIAERYASSFQDFDTYGYMDDIQEMDGLIERMADDISTGKDLTPYIAALEDNMYNAPDESTAGEMQALIDELTALQNGSDNALSSAERAALLEGIPSGEPIPDDVYYEAPGVQALRRAEKAANSIGDADSLQKNIDNQKIVRMADAVDDRSSSPLLTSDNGYDTAPSESLSNVNVDQNEGNVNNNAAYNGYWLRLLGDDNFLAQEAQQTGVEPEMLRQYAMANMGYGDMPSQTPPPANNIPHMNGTMPGDNMRTSQTYTNTGKNAEGWTEEEYNKYTDPSQFQYESIDEEESVRRATDMRQREGREGFKERMMNSNKASGAEIDGLMMEWRELGEEARALEAAGQDASDIWHESVRVFRKIQQLSTESAQGLQALAKWSRNTPEGMLADAENIINGKKKGEKNKLQEQLDKLAKQNKKVEFSESFVVQFLKEAGNLQGLDPDSREAREIMAKLGRMVNSQLPATFGEKLTSFLMDNMLGNFRTLITRNAGGNVGLNLAEQILQRPLAAGIDSLLSIKTGQRTQAGLTKEGLTEYIQGFAKGLKDEALDYSTGLHTSRTGQNTLGNAISSNRHVFKNKIMDRLDNLVKQGLSVGDRPFYEAVYNQTIGDYNRLRQRGVMSDDIQNLSAADFKLYSRAAAELNALAAVYQQDTTLSKALLGFKSAVGDLSRGILGVDILSQFSMPFVKTPANVIERAIDYSPLGGVRNAFRTHKERKSGTFDQNRFANETARNILGTALMGGGVALAANGLMSGSYSDDKDEKQAQRESGMQEYALNMGDKQMDIGWIPVVGSNNVAAAAAYDAFNNGEGNVFENAATGLKAGGQALFDQSMFQGLQRLFGTGETYNTDEGIVGNMGNVVKQGLGQGIPSLFRQAGQVIDPYQRDVAYSNEGKSFGFLDNYDLNSLANNVPFLREQVLAPKVATTGELLKENQGRNIGSKIFEDMILPGKVTKVEYSKLNEEAKRLKDDTTSADAYMPKAIRKNVDTEEHTLTNKEWSDYEQRYYKELTEVGTKILDSDFYKDADSTTQVKTLKNAYDAVKSAINSEYNGKEIKGAAKKYVEAGGGSKGVDAVVKYYRQGAEAEELGVNANTYRKKEDEKAGSGKQYAEEKNNKSKGISTSYKVVGKGVTTNQAVSEEIKTSAKDLGLQTKTYNKIADKAGANAEKVYKAVPELQRNGLGTSSAYYTYADALKVDPNLSSSEFAKTFNAIDADNSKGIKQDELIDYFNQNKYSQQQADRMWKMYGDSTWKKVPALVNGSFVKK